MAEKAAGLGTQETVRQSTFSAYGFPSCWVPIGALGVLLSLPTSRNPWKARAVAGELASRVEGDLNLVSWFLTPSFDLSGLLIASPSLLLLRKCFLVVLVFKPCTIGELEKAYLLCLLCVL